MAERIVEIGPAETLGTMAQRTLASKYEAYDAVKSVQRQILCYDKDMKEIYYDVDPEDDDISCLLPRLMKLGRRLFLLPPLQHPGI